MGWIAFPLVAVAFSGLSDRGYALARLVGLAEVALSQVKGLQVVEHPVQVMGQLA